MAPAQTGSGSTTRSVAAHRAASLIDDSRPTAIRARNAAPSAAPSATADTSTGRPVASAMACIHGSTRVPPPVATTRDTGTPLSSMRWRTTKPDAS